MPIDPEDWKEAIDLPPLAHPFPPIEMPPNEPDDDWDPIYIPPFPPYALPPDIRRALEDGEYEIVSVEVADIKRAESDFNLPYRTVGVESRTFL
jgi:hypothetical protein